MILWYFATFTYFHGYLEGFSMWAIVCDCITAHDKVCILHPLSRTSMLKPASIAATGNPLSFTPIPILNLEKNKTIQFRSVNSTHPSIPPDHGSHGTQKWIEKCWLYQPLFPCFSPDFSRLAPLGLVIGQWKLLRLERACHANTGMGWYGCPAA